MMLHSNNNSDTSLFVLGFANMFHGLVYSTLNVHIIKDTPLRKHTNEAQLGNSQYQFIIALRNHKENEKHTESEGKSRGVLYTAEHLVLSLTLHSQL